MRTFGIAAAAATLLLLHHPSACLADIVCPRIIDNDAEQQETLFVDDPSNSEDQRFNEISGLVFSPTAVTTTNIPVLYAINDSGGGQRLGIFDSGTGERILTLRLSALPSSRDWESMAIGSCGVMDGDASNISRNNNSNSNNNTDESSCLYIADIGDNEARGTGGSVTGRGNQNPYRIFKIREPQLDEFVENDEIPSSHMSVLQYDYFHLSSPTPFADCETMFLDHTGWGEDNELSSSIGDLYLVTKWSSSSDLTRLFRIPASAWTDHTNTSYSPVVVGTYTSTSLMGKQWTRGDMAFDGTMIALGDYDHSYLFPRCPGQSVADALVSDDARPYCRRWANTFSSDAAQFETIAWVPDGTRTLQISECRPKCNPPMVWTTFSYKDDDGSSTTQCSKSIDATIAPSTGVAMPPIPPDISNPPSGSISFQPTMRMPADASSPSQTPFFISIDQPTADQMPSEQPSIILASSSPIQVETIKTSLSPTSDTLSLATSLTGLVLVLLSMLAMMQ